MAISQAPNPTLPKQTVQVDALGGEVIVRALRLRERLHMQQRVRARAASVDAGQMIEEMVPDLLALAVVNDVGAPIYTAEQWDEFGASHQDTVLELFNTAMRLSGYDSEADRKN